jgi:hypothetical protein
MARAVRGGKDRVEIGAATSAPELFIPLKNACSKVKPRNTMSGSGSCPIVAPQTFGPLYHTHCERQHRVPIMCGDGKVGGLSLRARFAKHAQPEGAKIVPQMAHARCAPSLRSQ